eukprot:CAMPEP_0117467746 /NCGR_PEP_ID=MMETSP0784-20121206/5817_1 /TAXON_ID=39447 /ORGANISM="" /LENGTH=459 /DNA_ID=CAMNT_0005261729 /DNA_START=139 /DNA_END=1518 /DNA_ORIENTATION=+
MTNWSMADADKICSGGNVKEKEELEATWDGSELAVDRDSDDGKVRRFIQAKYTDKRWAGRGDGSRRSGSYAHTAGGGRKTSSVAIQGGGFDVKEAARKVASMFPDLTEANAVELVNKHGSVEAAVEAYLMESQPEKTPTGRGSRSAPGGGRSHKSTSSKRLSSSRRSSKTNAQEETWADAKVGGCGGFDGFDGFDAPMPMRTADASPAALGEASPSQLFGMAGMVGMVARGEISSPFGNFGSNPMGAGNWGNAQQGQFASAPPSQDALGNVHGPGAFGSAMPRNGNQANGWQQQQQLQSNALQQGQQGHHGPQNPLGGNQGWGQQQQPQQLPQQLPQQQQQQQQLGAWGPQQQQQQQLLMQLEQKKKQLQAQLQQMQQQQSMQGGMLQGMHQQGMQQHGVQGGLQQHMHKQQLPGMNGQSPHGGGGMWGSPPMGGLPAGMNHGMMDGPFQSNAGNPFKN